MVDSDSGDIVLYREIVLSWCNESGKSDRVCRLVYLKKEEEATKHNKYFLRRPAFSTVAVEVMKAHIYSSRNIITPPT